MSSEDEERRALVTIETMDRLIRRAVLGIERSSAKSELRNVIGILLAAREEAHDCLTAPGTDGDITPKRRARTPTRTDRFYSVAEAAKLLKISEVTIYREIAEGDFPALKFRGRYVIPARAIDQLEADALAVSDGSNGEA